MKNLSPSIKQFLFYTSMYITAAVISALIVKKLTTPKTTLATAGLMRTPNGLPANEMEG